MYTVLGYLAGFLGIAFGFFVHFLLTSTKTSFGVPFFAPYIPYGDISENENLYIKPVWKRERRNKNINTKKPASEKHISMPWRKNGK